MTFEHVYNKVKDVPYISKNNAKSLYDFIIKNKPSHILELGIAHGTASCYMAAALEEIGGGSLTCVDLIEVKDSFKPSVEEQLNSLGLNNNVEIHRMQSGYNWFLHNDIKSNSDNAHNICKPKYDLIIIDGPKNWTIDSSSFFLCDKLLKENGWIIWDDYKWTYSRADLRKDATDGISHRRLSEKELTTPHIKAIFELLVMQHPNYGNFIIQEDSDWVWANKIKSPSAKKIKYVHSHSISYYIIQKVRKLIRK
ncbi:class I SAM-dependent methyltransferase [Winogradskyella bathintestinalis]|uniref:Class I SAM-dependent methyltransferase n=1 Tax=Winogradskyella bathintestinalis TaxID=3035208 RepID=A0ABT7ZTS6_9FLAO|nr:class I SAM-dependent methyltransferase [Winogradskyella bathintestinalis]MDN3492424.1 class I SAM-dependent methyltransferase [Winogradskyella bathintestinalis]